MKANLIYLIFVPLLFIRCGSDLEDDQALANQNDSSAFIRLNGYEIDTAFLYADYKDPGAQVFYYSLGGLRCSNEIAVTQIESNINNHLPGIYFIHYQAFDTLGYPLSVVTRTVHMIENSSTFLNGKYNVACTCTAIAKSTSQATVNTGEYTVSITSSNKRNAFNLSELQVGSESLVPEITLEKNTLNVNFWSPDVVQISKSTPSGTLSPSNNSFTVQTAASSYYPLVSYYCVNIFTKKTLVEKQ